MRFTPFVLALFILPLISSGALLTGNEVSPKIEFSKYPIDEGADIGSLPLYETGTLKKLVRALSESREQQMLEGDDQYLPITSRGLKSRIKKLLRAIRNCAKVILNNTILDGPLKKRECKVGRKKCKGVKIACKVLKIFIKKKCKKAKNLCKKIQAKCATL